jgi:hypothetical protein
MDIVGSIGDSDHLLDNAVIAEIMGGIETLSSVSIIVRFNVGY